MRTTRRSAVDESRTRTALLDAAQELMLEEGYAAVSSRRVGAKAGMNPAMVHYYFGTMDGLFIDCFVAGPNAASSVSLVRCCQRNRCGASGRPPTTRETVR